MKWRRATKAIYYASVARYLMSEFQPHMHKWAHTHALLLARVWNVKTGNTWRLCSIQQAASSHGLEMHLNMPSSRFLSGNTTCIRQWRSGAKQNARFSHGVPMLWCWFTPTSDVLESRWGVLSTSGKWFRLGSWQLKLACLLEIREILFVLTVAYGLGCGKKAYLV
jgi:hypothetical protein